MKHAPYRVTPDRGAPRDVHVVSWSERLLLSLLGLVAIAASVFSGLGVVAGTCGWLFHSVDLPVAFIVSVVSASPLLLSIPIAIQSFRAVLRSFGYRVESHDSGLSVWERGTERAFLRFSDLERIDRAQGGGVVGVVDRFGERHRLEGLSTPQYLSVVRAVHPEHEELTATVARGERVNVRLGQQAHLELTKDRLRWSPAYGRGGFVLRAGGDHPWTALSSVTLDERSLSIEVAPGEIVRFESSMTDAWWTAAIAVLVLWESRAPIGQSPSPASPAPDSRSTP